MSLFDKCHRYTRAREIQATGYYPYFVPIEHTRRARTASTAV